MLLRFLFFLVYLFVITSSIGGLFYGKLKKCPIIHETAIQLVSPLDTSTSITDILNNLHNDGIAITAEDILNMSRQRDSNLKEPMITLTEDQKPVVVSGITPAIIPQEESLLDMFTSHQERDHGIIIFQRDVLDDENPTQDSVWNHSEELTVVIPPIEIKEEDISVIERGTEVQEDVQEIKEEIKEEVKEEVKEETQEETQEEEEKLTPQPGPSRRRKKEKKKKKEEYVNPKEQIVLADEQIVIPTTER